MDNSNEALANKPRYLLSKEEIFDVVYKAEINFPNEFGELKVTNDLKTITLRNVDIKEKFILNSGLELKNSIVFENCVFHEGVEMNNLTSDHEIIYQNCIFVTSFDLRSGKYKGKFTLSSNIFRGFLTIMGGEYDNELLIDNNEFLSHFFASEAVFNSILYIENNKFDDDIVISSGCLNHSLSFVKNSFKSSLYITGGIYKGYLRLVDNEILLDAAISGGSFEDVIIRGGYFKNDFAISGGDFHRDFSIYDVSFEKDFRISGGRFMEEFYFVSGFANNISFFKTSSASNYFIASSVIVNSIVFSGIMVKDSIVHVNSSCYSLSFIDFKNLGIIYFNNIECRDTFLMPSLEEIDSYENLEVYNELEIHGSDMGKVIFINCDLSNFQMEFVSSKIIEVFLSGTKMPNEIRTPDVSQQQFGYSQIKKIYENRGDKVEANRYFAREMEAYRSTLDENKNNERWEKINLWLNKISTNYGQSWERGVLSTLVASGLLFFIYCLSLEVYPSIIYPYLHIPSADEWSKFSKVISYLPEFINPLRKADYLAEQLLKIKGIRDPEKIEENITSLSRWVEGLSRIAIAYFIYQLIQAFRKHGKSGS